MHSAQRPGGRNYKQMADFVQDSQNKIAVREPANPIAIVTASNLIFQSVITDKPFACVEYMIT
jgi:isocitrate/isopropylmalate dehydrogenase